jgi:hypothetical protein
MLSLIREYPVSWWTTMGYAAVGGLVVSHFELGAEAIYAVGYSTAPVFVGLNFYEHYRRYVKGKGD